MTSKTTILKLGGSIITKKSGDGEFDVRTAIRLSKEIKKALKINPQNLILIHGGGGKTHSLAKHFKLQNGAKTKTQIQGSIKTHLAVSELGQNLSQILLAEGLSILPLQTSALFIVQNQKLLLMNPDIINQALAQNLIPLLSGDMIMNNHLNFSILSGDKIASVLAKKFNAQKILFATDVDGIYNDDPSANSKAELIKTISPTKLSQLLQKLPETNRDATGDMIGKILAIVNQKPSIEVMIFNGLKKNRVYQVLTNRKIVSTTIK